MAWTAPMTAVANTVFTAAQFNLHVRDNLNETAVAKATQISSIFVGNGLNSIVERLPQVDNVATSETTASTSYTDLATVGPSVTTATGARALVFVRVATDNSGANNGNFMSWDVTGASTLAASDNQACNFAGVSAAARNRLTSAYLISSLTPGTNTFTAKYKVTAGTGTFLARQIAVIPF
jgi:hypothetical protein